MKSKKILPILLLAIIIFCINLNVVALAEDPNHNCIYHSTIEYRLYDTQPGTTMGVCYTEYYIIMGWCNICLEWIYFGTDSSIVRHTPVAGRCSTCGLWLGVWGSPEI